MQKTTAEKEIPVLGMLVKKAHICPEISFLK